ncbi:hypothetical protein ACFU96_21675 [Streptomyces sp. NPDC057620]|uniref:hypothetical protein n=1 Tax=Streptomyces sp. NPDC057620 TaxID=3346185 RepID=UPI0036CAE3BC
MIAAAGLLLALICIAILAVGVGFACVAWQPRPDSVAFTVGLIAGLALGGACLLLAALHNIRQVLP